MMNALRTASSLLVATAVVLTFAGCTDTDARLKQAQAKIAATLPAPYYEDLVTEAVDVEGNVQLGRIGSGDANLRRIAGDLVVRRIGSGDVSHAEVGGRVDIPED